MAYMEKPEADVRCLPWLLSTLLRRSLSIADLAMLVD